MAVPTCPSCGRPDPRLFHEASNLPVNSCLLVDSFEEATAFPRGDLVLGFCRGCGFIWNTVFDPSLSEYSGRYEETQGFSPRFVEFACGLATRWIETYDLHDADILEIGSGKGEFLQMMCEIGPNRGTGIDPSYRPERMTGEAVERMTFIRDFYGERYQDLTGDAVVCRHTLEHIPAVGEFLGVVRSSRVDRSATAVLFELPDVYRVLEEVAFWDVYYEHCSYFTLGSLARLFRRHDFGITGLSVEFDNQYLLIEGHPGAGSAGPTRPEEDDLEKTEKAVDHFESHYPSVVSEWTEGLGASLDAGRRVVIWGAGSKGVSYLTTLGVTDEINYAVDINPHKHGKFMAGTGQEIVSPEFLRGYKPDEVIVMNRVYVPEIAANLEALGVETSVRAV